VSDKPVKPLASETALRNLASTVEILSQTRAGAKNAHHAHRIRFDAGVRGRRGGFEQICVAFYKTGESEARLIYGIPESDIVTLVFICDTKQKRIEIVTTVLPAKAKKGAVAPDHAAQRHRHRGL
jgi:hypothetical protein